MEHTSDVVEQTLDSNYFEELVDKMVLYQIPGITPEFIDRINDLPKSQKRMAILSILDKDLNLFRKIKALTDSNINKMEHIKDIILMLREYVMVGKVEKKKFGEVMTPLELVKEMIAKLPEEIWSNPNLKICDPANGSGVFPMVVIYKLMIGLKDWEPDDEKRYKHIVENMIYVCEIQPKNMFLYLCTIDPFDKYSINIYTGSFLESGFDKHMKEVWGVEKFNLILGNPPFQEPSSSENKSSDQGRVKLWMKFILRSLNISQNILFVSPNNWLTITCFLHKVFEKKLVFAEINSEYLVEKYFKKIGSSFSYYLLTSSNNNSSRSFYISGEKTEIDIFSLRILPTKDINIHSLSIFNKLLSRCNNKLKFEREKYHKIKEYKKCISIDRSKNNGFIISDSSIQNTSSYWYECPDDQLLNILINNLNTNFYKFVIKNIRSGMAIVSSINELPILYDDYHSDKDIYSLLNLTSSEIEYLEKYF